MWKENKELSNKIASDSLTAWVHKDTEEMILISYYEGEFFLNIYEYGSLAELYSGKMETVYRTEKPLECKEIARKIMNWYSDGNLTNNIESIKDKTGY